MHIYCSLKKSWNRTNKLNRMSHKSYLFFLSLICFSVGSAPFHPICYWCGRPRTKDYGPEFQTISLLLVSSAPHSSMFLFPRLVCYFLPPLSWVLQVLSDESRALASTIRDLSAHRFAMDSLLKDLQQLVLSASATSFVPHS